MRIAKKLYKVLKYHTIASGETRCTLEWVFSAKMDAPRIDVLRDEIENLLNPGGPEGILIAVEVNSTTRHRYAGGYKVTYEVRITLTNEECTHGHVSLGQGSNGST